MSFIYETQLENISVCDFMIEGHKKAVELGYAQQGCIAQGVVDKSNKNSMDWMPTDKYVEDYVPQLQKIIDEYTQIFPFSQSYGKWGVIESPQIQHYLPNQGFYKWHSERSPQSKETNNRHLVFMTYLNDVADGGTQFYHQNLTVKAVKGKTLIFPADWTHTHKGEISTTQEKYIITGWLSFAN
jgi:prolyl 4-hydroxylase